MLLLSIVSSIINMHDFCEVIVTFQFVFFIWYFATMTGGGSYEIRKTVVNDIQIPDLENVYSFELLMLSSDNDLRAWLQKEKMLAPNEIPCTNEVF